jgi:hypothetical protein
MSFDGEHWTPQPSSRCTDLRGLRLRHTGLPTTEESQTFHSYGWAMTLDRLAAVAAKGDPGPYPLADV